MPVDLDIQYAVSDQSLLPDEKQLITWVEKVLQGDAAHLGVRIVDEAESQNLNFEYRGKDKPTNVLSFPMSLPEEIGDDFLGDLVVCASIVAREAEEQHKTTEAHWAHMVIHGVLHLLGYDHVSDDQAEVMESLEVKYLEELGFENPYILKHERPNE